MLRLNNLSFMAHLHQLLHCCFAFFWTTGAGGGPARAPWGRGNVGGGRGAPWWPICTLPSRGRAPGELLTQRPDGIVWLDTTPAPHFPLCSQGPWEA